jgi:DNA-binding Xre family transcriptional regulator
LNDLVVCHMGARIIIKLREAVLAYKRRTGERMTYAILAERTGLAQGTLHNIGGQRSYNATLKTIALICRELGVTPGELLTFVDEPAKRAGKLARRKK